MAELLLNLKTKLESTESLNDKLSLLMKTLIDEGYKTETKGKFSDQFLKASITHFSNSVNDYFSSKKDDMIQKNDDAKEAIITEQLRKPLEEQQQLQGELAKLLAEIQTE